MKLQDVPLHIVEALESMFAENADPMMTHGEAQFHAGTRKVVQTLRKTYNREQTYVLSKRRRTSGGTAPGTSP